MKKISILFSIFAITALSAVSQLPPENSGDNVDIAAQDSTTVLLNKPKRNIFQKLVDYFNEARREKPEKTSDFSILVGPHYASDTGFGAGVFGVGLYRTAKDSVTQTSNINSYFDATTKARFKLGLYGLHFFPGDKSRLDYDLAFHYIKTKYWGIGYYNNKSDNRWSEYRYLKADLKLEYNFQVLRDLWIGPALKAQYNHATDIDNKALWQGQRTENFNYGPGLTAVYDTRDCVTEPFSGTRIYLSQYFFPRFIGNKHNPFSLTEVQASFYFKAWKDAIIATNLHGAFSYGDTPWNMMPRIGDAYFIRGIYENRYRDKNAADFCIELRQHVWKTSGIVVWGGGGYVFPKFSKFKFSQFIPNYGIGYRYRFKPRVNLRIDLGFSPGDSNLIFSINEAF